MQNIGLFFGSFNPVHVGHLIIANYMGEHTDLDQVWLVVTPQNPLKKKRTLANNYDRLHLVNLAIEDNPRLQASSIEFGLPQPSYTIDTLTYLKEKHPDDRFTLIMGGDNLLSLPRWKNYEIILRDYRIFVYSRPDYKLGPLAEHEHVQIFSDVPQMSISASFIRKSLQNEKSVRYMLPDSVHDYLMKTNLYRD
ncbi:MAG TPA: nicotinate (nicotinamide) nucleotide adenylyltransferase [Saprospiraceae bacterium]|nr:nicotinate (nicotinamide) nucleotide adenylyltransferase [Saprospiraceae bacterium]